MGAYIESKLNNIDTLPTGPSSLSLKEELTSVVGTDSESPAAGRAKGVDVATSLSSFFTVMSLMAENCDEMRVF